MITPPMNRPSPVMQIEGRRRAEIDDDGIALEQARRRQGVDDPVGPDGERFVDVEPDRQFGGRRSTPASRWWHG